MRLLPSRARAPGRARARAPHRADAQPRARGRAHARRRRRPARCRSRSPATAWSARSPAAAAARGGALGVLPGGRGNDFGRRSGIPLRRRGCGCCAAAWRRPIDLGEVDGRAFIGIASLGFDSDANRDRQRSPARLGRVVYVYGAMRRWPPGGPARFNSRSTASGAASRAGRSPPPTPAPTAAACSWPPTPGSTTACWTSCDRQDGRAGAFCSTCPGSSRARHVESPSVDRARGREVRVSADRPFTVYADGDPIGELPVTVRARQRALRVLLPA